MTALLALVCLAALAILYRPLLLTSTLPEVAEARGISTRRIDLLFLVLVALATTTAVPVVGALLMFSLMVGPPAAARALTRHPAPAMVLAVVLAAFLFVVGPSVFMLNLVPTSIGSYLGDLPTMAARTADSPRNT